MHEYLLAALLAAILVLLQFGARQAGGIVWLRRMWFAQKVFYVLLLIAALGLALAASAHHPLGLLMNPLILMAPVAASFVMAWAAAVALGIRAEPVDPNSAAAEWAWRTGSAMLVIILFPLVFFVPMEWLAPPSPPQARPKVADPVPLTADQERALKSRSFFSECSPCPMMVVVPAGEFMMGSEEDARTKPMHKITINEPFAVAADEIGTWQWEACVKNGACKHSPSRTRDDYPALPVTDVSWDDIVNDYLPWLSRSTGKAYRLLSEAEWEYVARAGSTTHYSWGDDMRDNMAICKGCPSQWNGEGVARGGSPAYNAFSLLNVHGNAAEWVQDCYLDTYANTPIDGSAVSGGPCARVYRGGSAYDEPDKLRSAFRASAPQSHRHPGLGFRVARSLAR